MQRFHPKFYNEIVCTDKFQVHPHIPLSEVKAKVEAGNRIGLSGTGIQNHKIGL